MAQLMDYAEYLSKEIGPRPAGTEEEQQAALYITECFQKDAGFSAQIEEFTSASNLDGIAAVPGIVIIVVAILGMFFPVAAIPAFIVALVAAIIYALEALGHPIVTNALARGASQNVVAKYQPGGEDRSDRRGRSQKIILVAHYDSGKVTPPLVERIQSMSLPVPVDMACVGAMGAAVFFMLLHIFFNTGIGAIIINILTIIALIVSAYPVVRAIMYRMAPYNEGANNNATGTAAILEVARRISRGSVSEADLINEEAANAIRLHGEEAARQMGLVPEGAQILYDAEQLVPPSELGEYDEEERLLAAKAAIAALTGKPVERRVYGSVATKLVNSRVQEPEEEEPAPKDESSVPAIPAPGTVIISEDEVASALSAPAEPAREPFQVPYVQSAPAEAEPAQVEGYEQAPSWFVSAQQKAKKPAGETGPIQRSRYADAIEAAEREAADRERERQEQERLQREAELKAREEATRAAIASSLVVPEVQPQPEPIAEEPVAEEMKPEEPMAEEPAREEREAPMVLPEVIETPVFVPYSQAHAEESTGHKPAVDEFAASLGETAMFDPRQVRLAGVPTVQDEAAPAESASAALLADLPAIDQNKPDSVAKDGGNPSRSGMFRKLRTDVPSMSGVIRMQQAGEDVSQKPGEMPARPVPAPAPEQAPELALAPEPAPEPAPAPQPEPVQDEADQATVAMDYAAEFERSEDRERPAARPHRSRRSTQMQQATKAKAGLFSRFRRKDREPLDETPQEWLDIEDDFDARTVGRKRGSWESFRDESAHYDDGYDRGYEDDYEDDYDDGYDDRRGRRWEGGGYSRVRLGRVDTRSGEDSEADKPAVVEEVEYDEDQQIAEEIEHIYHFRNPLYNTEIWFVALGSELAGHGGAKAFIAEHADELRGSMIVEVESLGAGELTLVSDEGRLMPVIASSRAKRFLRNATAATGINPGSISLVGYDSAASVMQEAGYQTMHLLGVEDGLPALKGSPDDILENVDDLLFDDHVNFLMEMLKK